MLRWSARWGLRDHPRRAVAAAIVLWLVWAGVMWNVVFDRLLVLAGRRFVHAAATAASTGQPYLLIDPWMREATTAALRCANGVAGALLVVGGISIVLAGRRAFASPRLSSGPDSRPPAPAVGATD